MNDTLENLQDELLAPETGWAAAGFLAALLGAAVGRRLLKSGWKKSTGKQPPINPAHQDTTWGEALVWGVVTGALIGVVRAISRRGASSVRQRWA